jgi:hypothetical protein
MLTDSNFDDLTLQPGDDREFQNQFTEFLRKNIPIEETPKIVRLSTHKEIKKEKRKKTKNKKSILEYFL